LHNIAPSDFILSKETFDAEGNSKGISLEKFVELMIKIFNINEGFLENNTILDDFIHIFMCIDTKQTGTITFT
jgi:hypothetical protein